MCVCVCVCVCVFQYCHYVAGLVGIGLSRLFSASELESEEVGKDHSLANSMGLFLQKTNIIRDYLEDMQQGRHFWPKEVAYNVPIYHYVDVPYLLNVSSSSYELSHLHFKYHVLVCVVNAGLESVW